MFVEGDAITRIVLVIQADPTARVISPHHANPGVGPRSRENAGRFNGKK